MIGDGLQPFFSLLKIIKLQIDFVNQITELIWQLVTVFFSIPFSQDCEVGMFSQHLKLVERNVIIGFYVLLIINVGQHQFLAGIELETSETGSYNIYIGSDSIT